MAKMRVVNTRFWIDDYISHLDPVEKLLFLYFLTNPMTDICGVYEIPLKVVAVETGIEESMVKKILGRFESENKIFYEKGWVAIVNFKKHQSLNPKVLAGIENGLSKAPKEILDRLSIGYDRLSHLNSNINSNLNSNPNGAVIPTASKRNFNPLGGELLKAFEVVDPKNKTYYSNKTQRSACDFLISEYSLESCLKVIAQLPKVNTQKLYLAQITSPYELKENWAKLMNILAQKKLEVEKMKTNII